MSFMEFYSMIIKVISHDPRETFHISETAN